MVSVATERRFGRGIEVREAGDAKDGRIGTLVGYAAVFDSWSEDLGGFREIIRRGAFKDSLSRGDDIRALGHHDTQQIVGRRSAGTLLIEEDATGLRYEIALPDTTSGRDLLVSTKRGDLSGSSFGFSTRDDKWSTKTVDGKAVWERELIRVDIFEISVVVWPAYADTSAEARSARTALLEVARRNAGTEARPRLNRALAKRRRWIG